MSNWMWAATGIGILVGSFALVAFFPIYVTPPGLLFVPGVGLALLTAGVLVMKNRSRVSLANRGAAHSGVHWLPP